MPETVGDVQILEFQLEHRNYCIVIAHVGEIVDEGERVPLPNAEPRVEGVMDLRGTTTTISNPKTVPDLDATETGDRVVGLETDDERNVGWLIDAVDRVVTLDEESLDESVENESVKGIVRQDHGFVVRVKPERING